MQLLNRLNFFFKKKCQIYIYKIGGGDSSLSLYDFGLYSQLLHTIEYSHNALPFSVCIHKF